MWFYFGNDKIAGNDVTRLYEGVGWNRGFQRVTDEMKCKERDSSHVRQYNRFIFTVVL